MKSAVCACGKKKSGVAQSCRSCTASRLRKNPLDRTRKRCPQCGGKKTFYAPLCRQCVGWPRGYHQSPEHVQKRIRRGVRHQNWKGDDVTVHTGRLRAQHLHPTRPCAVCGAVRVDRHHIDGNTRNNAGSNIAFLCRRHHMEADGRLEALRARNKNGA
jgi:hypothetical protein